MATRTICDLPECDRAAAWKVELSDVREGGWVYGSFTISSGNPEKRTSVDTCEKHLIRVAFDPDEIADFQSRDKATA